MLVLFDVGTGNREDLFEIITNGDDEAWWECPWYQVKSFFRPPRKRGCGLRWLWRWCPCSKCLDSRGPCAQ